jgi:hypothetical protein
MNLNSIRTMLSIAALVVLGLGVAAGCTVDQVSGVIKECTNSWLPVAVSAKVSMGLMAINQFLKGFQGGSFLDGLFKRTVVVSKLGEIGTVRLASVEAPGK